MPSPAMSLPESMPSEVHARFQTEERLRAIADHVPALIAYVDTEQRYRFANETFRTWFGLDPETMIGRTVEEVFGPAVAERSRGRMMRAMAGETVYFQSETRVGNETPAC